MKCLSIGSIRFALLVLLLVQWKSSRAQLTELKHTYWYTPQNTEFLTGAGQVTLPYGSVIYDGGVLYGTTSRIGNGLAGMIFKVNPDGTGYSELFHFNSGAGDGGYPMGALVSDGTFLYGAAANYAFGLHSGTIFRINKDGTGFTTLYYFADPDGANPNSTLWLDGTTLYGTTMSRGANDLGTIFKIETDGTGFTKLYDFDAVLGGKPFGDLYSDGTSLFGCTVTGGATSEGTLYRVGMDGTGYTVLHSFSTAEGYRGSFGNQNFGKLVSDGTYLYGTNNMGGASSFGNVFRIKSDGTGYSSVLDYNPGLHGYAPTGSLVFNGTSLFGTADMLDNFGIKIHSVVFRVNPNGSGFAVVAHLAPDGYDKRLGSNIILAGTTVFGLSGYAGNQSYGYPAAWNTDGSVYRVETDGTGFNELLNINGIAEGSFPAEALVSDGTYLYGANYSGGVRNSGNIFRIKLDGSGYGAILTNFPSGSPGGGLLLSAGQLFGVTGRGGATLDGTIYRINSDGTGFTTLHDFANVDGNQPNGTLIGVGGSLFGVTSFGGTNGNGVIFRIDPDGSNFLVIHEFPTPAQGRYPSGTLFFDGIFLYGYTLMGGTSDLGALYKIKPDGTGYAKLLDFTGTNGAMNIFDAHLPALTSDGTFLYGLTAQGGANGNGTVFRLMPDGTGFTKLLDNGGGFNFRPNGSLLRIGTTLYGMARGKIFRIETNGTGYQQIATPSGCSQAFFSGKLFSDGTYLYGPTEFGVIKVHEIQVTNFSPISGPVGTVVTLTGQNLLAGTLRFNGLISASSGTPTSISATVPGGTTTGPITITAGCVVATTANFTVSSCSITPPVATDGNHCGPGAVALSASGAVAGQEYRWYDVPSAGISQGTLAAFTTPSLTVTGTYYASIFEIATGCESTRTAAVANIRTVPPAPGASGANNCTPASLTLSATGGVNGDYRWYTAATGGTALVGEVNSTYITPVLSTTTSYFVSLANAFCESNTRTAAVAAINNVAAQNVTTVLCNATSATLEGPAGFTGYLWSNGATTQQITVTTAGSYTLVVTNAAGCNSPASVPVTFGADFCNQSPSATPVSASTTVGVGITIPVLNNITDPDNNLDLSSLSIKVQPLSGATATINANHELVVNYSGVTYAGTDQLKVEICDQSGVCIEFDVIIILAGEIKVYNAVSPNGDGKNDFLLIEFIDVLPDMKDNKLTILNRWGSVVFEATNYNNSTTVFKGLSADGKELPTGTYYYVLEFSGGAPKQTGFISLRK